MSSKGRQGSAGSTITTLTPIDHLMPRSYVVGALFCFPMSRRTDPLEVYEHLKLGLEDTIKEIPFLGGRVVSVEGVKGRYQVETEKLNGSSPLIYNDMRRGSKNPWVHSYKTISAAKFSSSLIDWDRFTPVAEYIQMDRPPVIAAQANFIDGGAVLHFSTIHTVCDALALHNVLSVWSRKVKESWSAEPSEASLSITPASLDRSPLMHGNPNAQRMDVREFRLQAINSRAPDPKGFLIGSVPSSASEMQLTSFTMSKSNFVGLRDAISEADLSGPYVTANNALAAFLWDRINHARFSRTPDSSSLTGNLSVATDGRTRLDPPIPATFMGNAALGFPVPLPIHPKSVYSAALAVQEALVDFDDKHLRNTIGFLNSLEDVTEERLMYTKTLNPTLVVSNLRDMKYYQLDWGTGLGFAENCRAARPFHDCIARAIPLPTRRDGSTDILVWIEKWAMERLEADKEWCKWVKYVCT